MAAVKPAAVRQEPEREAFAFVEENVEAQQRAVGKDKTVDGKQIIPAMIDIGRGLASGLALHGGEPRTHPGRPLAEEVWRQRKCADTIS